MKLWPKAENSGSVRLRTHPMAKSRTNRGTKARVIPSLRANGCCGAGSLPTRSAMTTKLSTLSTTSRAVRVRRLSHT